MHKIPSFPLKTERLYAIINGINGIKGIFTSLLYVRNYIEIPLIPLIPLIIDHKTPEFEKMFLEKVGYPHNILQYHGGECLADKKINGWEN